jgi:hypothetical protein
MNTFDGLIEQMTAEQKKENQAKPQTEPQAEQKGGATTEEVSKMLQYSDQWRAKYPPKVTPKADNAGV